MKNIFCFILVVIIHPLMKLFKHSAVIYRTFMNKNISAIYKHVAKNVTFEVYIYEYLLECLLCCSEYTRQEKEREVHARL